MTSIVSTTEAVFDTTTPTISIALTTTPQILTSESAINLPPQYLKSVDLDSSLFAPVTPNILIGINKGNNEASTQNLTLHGNHNLKEKLIQNLRILTLLKSSNASKSIDLESIAKTFFPIHTTTSSKTPELSNSFKEFVINDVRNSTENITDYKSKCSHNETRLLVTYGNTEIILCRNESLSNRMNFIDKKLKKKIQNKMNGLYRVQMVSNYFLASALNCSSVYESLKNNAEKRNLSFTENLAFINSNYTVCRFLNVTQENRINILWKIYLISEECYQIDLKENVSVKLMPLRNISMRIQKLDAGKNDATSQ